MSRLTINDCQKLLDNGWRITLHRNALGSYTAKADRGWEDKLGNDYDESDDRHITDDFTPEKVLYRLVEKVTTGRIVDSEEQTP